MAKGYKNPAATATVVFLRETPQGPEIMYIQRKSPPYAGMLSLPGGYLNCDRETLERAAQRESKEEVKVKVLQKDLELICVNSSPKRDPRGHVIDHVYLAKKYTGEAEAGDDAVGKDWDPKKKGIYWTPLYQKVSLAFDHEIAVEIVRARRLNK